MTEQDKANIFDVVIKPFLCPDANNEAQGGENMFAEAIRTLINTALLAQRNASLIARRKFKASQNRDGESHGSIRRMGGHNRSSHHFPGETSPNG